MGNTYNYLKAVFQDLKQENSRHPVFIFILLSLVCVPSLYAANSVSLGLLAFVTLITFKKQNASAERNLLLPVLLYLLMALTLFWTIDTGATATALSKELPLVIIPLCFLLFPALSSEQKQKIIKYFSSAMTLYCIFYIIRACIRFVLTKDIHVFFYHQLVTEDVNAIHSSIYVSVAFFYFFTKPARNIFETLSAGVLFITIFLLSSKNVIGVFICLILVYYLFFSAINKKMRIASLIAFLLFVCSVALIPEIKSRFMIEYQTTMTDSTINESLSNGTGKVYNVSVRQAWNDKVFHANDYFPGTAFRVYQFRIFLEMLHEDHIFFTGYGLNASYPRIEKKTTGYGLFLGNNLRSGYQKKNFHDQYIQNFAELGVFGFLLLVAMVIVNLKNALKAKDFVHISFAVLMISLFLTESFLWRQRGVTFFTMMYCLFNSGMTIKKNKPI